MKLRPPTDYSQWHRTFAWWPTEVAPGDIRWLEWVERRVCDYVQTWAGDTCRLEYRAVA